MEVRNLTIEPSGCEENPVRGITFVKNEEGHRVCEHIVHGQDAQSIADFLLEEHNIIIDELEGDIFL